jgi:hypothetical protein
VHQICRFHDDNRHLAGIGAVDVLCLRSAMYGENFRDIGTALFNSGAS